MSLSYVGAGTAVYSNGNPSPTAVTGQVAGDLLVLAVGTKPDTTPATTPSGWTQLGAASGGVGTTGIDVGPMRVGLFYKVASSDGETPGAVTISGNNVSAVQLFAYRSNVPGATFDIAGTGAADTSTGSPHSALMPVHIGLTVGDQLLAVGVIPTDVSTPSQFSAETVSAPGMTTVSMTEINEWDTSTGQDMGGWVARGAVVTGTSTGAPTVSATAGGTTTNVAGPIYLVRIREGIAATPKSASDSGTILAAESSSIVATVPPSLQLDPSTPAMVAVSSFSSANLTTASFTAPDKALLVAFIAGDNGTADNNLGFSVSDSQGLVWSQVGRRTVNGTNIPAGTGVDGGVYIWAATTTSSIARTVTATATGVTDKAKMLALKVFTDSSGSAPTVGAVVGSASSSGIPTVTLVTTSNDSWVWAVCSDWTQQGAGTFPAGQTGTDLHNPSGLYTGRVWRQDNVTPNSGTSVTMNMSGPSGQMYNELAIEIKTPVATNTPIASTDSGTFSATEAAQILSTISTIDSGEVSSVETRAVASFGNRTDLGTVSATESISLSSAVSLVDSGAFSATDTSFVSVLVSVLDSGTYSGLENATIFSAKALFDGGNLSAIESRANSITSTTGDSGTVTAAEIAIVSVTFGFADEGTHLASEVADVAVPYYEFINADSGNVSVAETAVIMTSVFTTDAASYGSVESATEAKSISLSESGQYSVSESSIKGVNAFESDEGNLSVIEVSDVLINDAKDLVDNGQVSIQEDANIFGDATADDSVQYAVNETSNLSKSISLHDSGIYSVSDAAIVFNDRPASDFGVIVATEASDVSIFGTVEKMAADSGTVVSSEFSSIDVALSASDETVYDIVESVTGSATTASSDIGTTFVDEVAEVVAEETISDSGTLDIEELTNIFVSEGLDVLVWNGSEFVNGHVFRWDGSSLVEVEVLTWNGIDWS
jgi:hypothetical protein